MNAIDQRAREKLHPLEMIYRRAWGVTSPRLGSIPWSLKAPLHPELPDEPSHSRSAFLSIRTVLMVAIVMVVGGIARRLGADWMLAVGAGIVAFVLFSLPHELKQSDDLRKRLVRSQFQLCPWCGHDLFGRPREAVECPECGRFAPRREVVRFWARHFRTQFARSLESSRMSRNFVLTVPWQNKYELHQE